MLKKQLRLFVLIGVLVALFTSCKTNYTIDQKKDVYGYSLGKQKLGELTREFLLFSDSLLKTDNGIIIVKGTWLAITCDLRDALGEPVRRKIFVRPEYITSGCLLADSNTVYINIARIGYRGPGGSNIRLPQEDFKIHIRVKELEPIPAESDAPDFVVRFLQRQPGERYISRNLITLKEIETYSEKIDFNYNLHRGDAKGGAEATKQLILISDKPIAKIGDMYVIKSKWLLLHYFIDDKDLEFGADMRIASHNDKKHGFTTRAGYEISVFHIYRNDEMLRVVIRDSEFELRFAGGLGADGTLSPYGKGYEEWKAPDCIIGFK